VVGERVQLALAGLATVKVTDAVLPLWRPLAWKVSLRPGIVDPAKPLGTVKEAATSPPGVAVAVVSTVAPKVMSTPSEGANPRQDRPPPMKPQPVGCSPPPMTPLDEPVDQIEAQGRTRAPTRTL
jgi:hypothetical protein